MTRRNQEPATTIDARDGAAIVAAILAGELEPQRYAEVLALHRANADDGGLAAMCALAEAARESRSQVQTLEGICEQMQALVDKLADAPWYPARVVDTSDVDRSGHVMVSMGGAQRLVVAGENVDLDELEVGDAVYVSRGGDAIMAVALEGMDGAGELAAFESELGDGRLLVKIRDEEVLLRRSRGVEDAALQRGSLLRIDRSAQLALEDLGRQNTGSGTFVDDIAGEVVKVGGARARHAVERLYEALSARLVAPELAARYGLKSRRAVLLSGAPGVGKTLAVRAAIQKLAASTARRCRFAIVRPAEFESPWVGSTEDNIRSTFARLAEEAGDDLAVLFLDEIEAIGRIRGAAMSRHSDKFLAALLVELDGLVRRGNIAVIAATNRKDMLDPALLERIAEIDIEVPRPDLEAAREMFGVHLAQDLPYCTRDGDAAETRERMIDAAVTALYAPNADTKIATVHFRDSTTRSVQAQEMMSGRLVEQICHQMREAGFRRAMLGEDGALGVQDARECVCAALEKLRSTLTSHNIRSWVEGLPGDIDIVRVAVERPSVARPYRYLRAA